MQLISISHISSKITLFLYINVIYNLYMHNKRIKYKYICICSYKNMI